MLSLNSPVLQIGALDNFWAVQEGVFDRFSIFSLLFIGTFCGEFALGVGLGKFTLAVDFSETSSRIFSKKPALNSLLCG